MKAEYEITAPSIELKVRIVAKNATAALDKHAQNLGYKDATEMMTDENAPDDMGIVRLRLMIGRIR